MTKKTQFNLWQWYAFRIEAGGVHSLARTAKIKVVELRETLSEYSLKDLPKDKDIQQQIAKDNAQKLEKLLLTLEEQRHREHIEALERYEQEYKLQEHDILLI